MEENKSEWVDTYIANFPAEVQVRLTEIRNAIKKAAPAAIETISYKMPAYKMNGILVYFAAYKNHIGFYPTGAGIAHFKEEISSYKNSKGAVQFPIDKKIPAVLVQKITKFRLLADAQNIKKKAKK